MPAASSKPAPSSKAPPKSSTAKAGTRKPTVPAAVQRETASRAAALEDAQSKAKAAEERADAAEQQTVELQAALRAADERQGNLSTLLATAGYSSMSLNGIDWTVGKAKDLLAEEAASMAEVDALLERVRSNAQHVRTSISEQEDLRDQIAAHTVHRPPLVAAA